MVAYLFRKLGHVATIPLEDRRAFLQTGMCITDGLRSLVPESPKDGPPRLFSSSWLCQYAHSSNNGWFLSKTEAHPPYSPDISPWDFFLFLEVKKQLKGTLFETVEDACRVFTRAVEDITRSTWAEEWNKWFHQMAKCMAAGGSFFEKWSNFLSGESNQ